MNCMSLLISPTLFPFLNSSQVTVYTKLPIVEAVHEIVPVIGLIENWPPATDGGLEYPAMVYHVKD